MRERERGRGILKNWLPCQNLIKRKTIEKCRERERTKERNT